MTTEPWALGLVVLAGFYGALAPIYLKKGIEVFTFKNIRTSVNIIKGLLIYLTGTVIFIFALKGGELSILYPLVALSYVWTCIYSKYLLQERMNSHKWFGIFLVVLGAILISS